MKIDMQAVRQCLKTFNFKTLFREQLGWDNHHAQLDVPIDGTTVSLTAVAQKRGFVAYVCPTIPDRPIRLKIDHQVAKSTREHFIIYTDQTAGRQVWQWVRREPGKPMASRDHRFDVTQSGDPLIHRLDQIAVSLDEEEAISVVDVAGRARAAFDVEKVTKQFYERFKAEHAAFQKLIKGIKEDPDLQWYTSLMLNRLMFVYFIQKKGFLDDDLDYLRNRLKMVRQHQGKDKFVTFYRYFLLRLFHDGLGKAQADARCTTVIIKSPVEYYRDALQHEPETIAISTIEHCLEYFIADKTPSIYLADSAAGYDVELGKLFRDELKSDIKRDEFAINGSKFRVTHLLVRGRKNSRHALHFCAHSRRVKDEGLTGKIPGLIGGLRTPGATEDLAYQGYVSGDVLDQLVDVERASFDFEGLFSYDPDKPPEGTVSFDALLDAVLGKTKQFLGPILKPILEANQARIRTQIETTYPQYRYLLKHRADEVASIAPGIDGKDLDIALYKIEQKLDVESRESLSKELAEAKNPDEPADDRKARLDKLLEELNDSGISKLARHVAYRRAVIEFLEDQIGLQGNGKYSLEEAVHAAVCPTRASSEETSSAKMNLWLLDDRLYFHYYLASDMPFKDMMETVKQESEDRPDLAVFHRPMAFSDSLDQIGAVVLVEFKRPVRDDFKMDDPEKNPVSQVLKYVSTLKAGEGRRAKGQAIHIRDNTPFYAYIVADFTKSIREIAHREDFTPTPDGEGYFKFYKNYNCYVEMISFQKMIRDAKKRNQAFFDKLNIPFHS